MTLNANEPTDVRMVSELAAYIRANRVSINTLIDFENTELEIAAGAVSIGIGTDLSVYGSETVILSGAGAAVITTMLNGFDGQTKMFIFQDANVGIADGNIKANGAFYLNTLPAGTTFAAGQDDILLVVNIGGDGGVTDDGYWKEVFRVLSVK